MRECHHCGKSFEPVIENHDPAVQAGIHLAMEKYGDLESTCCECLASRGRLAMMYDPEMFD